MIARTFQLPKEQNRLYTESQTKNQTEHKTAFKINSRIIIRSTRTQTSILMSNSTRADAMVEGHFVLSMPNGLDSP